MIRRTSRRPMEDNDMEKIEDLIAALVIAREKAEALDLDAVSEALSKHIGRLRREVKAAAKKDATKK